MKRYRMYFIKYIPKREIISQTFKAFTNKGIVIKAKLFMWLFGYEFDSAMPIVAIDKYGNRKGSDE